MTAVATTGGRRSAHSAVPIERDCVATIALIGYGVVAMVGFARVFSGWDFVSNSALIIVTTHLLSLVFRRVRLSGWVASPLTLIVTTYLTLAIYYGWTFSGFFPTGLTRSVVNRDIDLVIDQFPTAVAPVLYDSGWALLAGLSALLIANLADLFTFRAMARAEALVPGGVVFIFVAALGSPRLRVELTMLLIAAAIITVAALRWYHDRSTKVRPTNSRRMSFAAPAVLLLAVLIAALGGWVGPKMPGARADPLVETKGRSGTVTTIASPLVDIRSRLTNQGNLSLFRVNAERQAYWRVTTLPEFDGDTFRLPARELEQVDTNIDSSASEMLNRQRYQILALTGQTIPAAADPIQAGGKDPADESLALRINRDTSTLIVPEELTPGDEFTVVSSRSDITPKRLRAATASGSGDDLFTDLPDDLPNVVADTAQQITADLATDYDKALALQDWFRSEFKYSLEVQSGHGNSAIETFLDTRTGYCEQFAATFAAMARTVGMPSRVGVGYTPGVLNEEGWYDVRGKNAHAWPEIYFDGVGWVAFEPTPGRGAPGAEGYTGVAAEQDDSGARDVPEELAVPNTVPDLTTPKPIAPADSIPDAAATPQPVPQQTTAGADPADDRSSVPWRWIIGLLVVALAAIFPWWWRRIQRRREDHLPPGRRAISAWRRSQRAAQRVGVADSSAMSHAEWAAAIGGCLPVAARPVESLATTMDDVVFGNTDDNVDVDDVGHWADQVEAVASASMSTPNRAKAFFSLH